MFVLVLKGINDRDYTWLLKPDLLHLTFGNAKCCCFKWHRPVFTHIYLLLRLVCVIDALRHPRCILTSVTFRGSLDLSWLQLVPLSLSTCTHEILLSRCPSDRQMMLFPFNNLMCSSASLDCYLWSYTCVIAECCIELCWLLINPHDCSDLEQSFYEELKVFTLSFPDQITAATIIWPPQMLQMVETTLSPAVCVYTHVWPSSVGDNSSIFSALFAPPSSHDNT